MCRRNGWVFIDIVAGTALVGLLTAVLIVAANRHSRAMRHLADDRAAARLAESELISLQTGQEAATATGGTFVTRALPGKAAAPGFSWVEVEAAVSGRTTSLVGLVPSKSLQGNPGGAR